MACPTCDEIQDGVGDVPAIGGDATFWCPRCGTLEMHTGGVSAFKEIRELCTRAVEAEASRDKLMAAFKQFVHEYLDAHDVPHHPPGTHGEHGCRIGDRMDWLMDRVDKTALTMESLREIAAKESGCEVTVEGSSLVFHPQALAPTAKEPAND